MRWLIALTVTIAAMTSARAMGVRESGDWTAICDNLRSCTAILVQEDRYDPNAPFAAYLRLTREGDADSVPRITVVVTSGGGAVTPLIDGRPIRGIAQFKLQLDINWPLDAADAGPSFYTSQFDGAQSSAVLRALRHGGRLTLTNATGVSITFALAGMSSTLRWIDAEQMRAGTRSAMLDRGDRTDGPPPVPPLPKIAAPPKAPQDRLPAAPPPLAEIIRTMDCGKGRVSLFITQRLAANTILWAPACTPDEIAHRAYVSDEDGNHFRAVDLPAPPDVDAAAFHADLAGRSDDPRMAGYYPWLTRCGRQIEWLWTGSAFAIAGMWWVMDCRGVLEVDRTPIYRAETVAAP